jgi:hypothetical protein
MNQLFMFSGPSGDIPHLPTALGAGISSKGKSAGCPRVSEESVE